MDISFITEYISPITLGICLVVGFIIKGFDNEKANRFIPLIVAIVGVLICAWDAMAITPSVVAAGLISGLASTGLYEALKNLLNLGTPKEPEIVLDGVKLGQLTKSAMDEETKEAE